MQIIGLYGSIGSGKSEAANFITSSFKAAKLSFAAPIREACSILFDFTEEQMVDRHRKEIVDQRWGISPREAFRLIGHGFRQSVCDDIWIKHMSNRINMFTDSNNLVIIDDVRYQNEIDFIEKECNGCIVQIYRKDNPYMVNNNHASDLQQVNFSESSIIVDNDSGIEELKVKLLFMLRDIGFLHIGLFNTMSAKINATNSWRAGLWRC